MTRTQIGIGIAIALLIAVMATRVSLPTIKDGIGDLIVENNDFVVEMVEFKGQLVARSLGSLTCKSLVSRKTDADKVVTIEEVKANSSRAMEMRRLVALCKH